MYLSKQTLLSLKHKLENTFLGHSNFHTRVQLSVSSDSSRVVQKNLQPFFSSNMFYSFHKPKGKKNHKGKKFRLALPKLLSHFYDKTNSGEFNQVVSVGKCGS